MVAQMTVTFTGTNAHKTASAKPISGLDNNSFEPNRNVNRAEIATILNRLTKFLDIKNNILVEVF